jgi:DedD protein
MAEDEDVNALRRRGRRRLVGAIALVLAAVIVLPMIFDSAPRQSPPPVSVRIPSEDDTGFAPKVTPKSPPAAAQPAKAAPEPAKQAAAKAPKAEAPKPEAPKAEAAPAKPAEKPAAAASPAPAAGEAERLRAEAALAGAQQYYVQVGAYADPAGVIDKLKAAGIPHYTESVPTKKGSVTRVRAGPFPSPESAQKALEQLKALGFKPGSIAFKS